jgi:hypothetical protein
VVLEDGVRVIDGLSKPVQCLPLRALIHRQGQKISGGELVGVIVDPVALAVQPIATSHHTESEDLTVAWPAHPFS